MTPLYVLLGAAFGFVLSRSGAADYGYVQGMFLFERPQLYGVIGTAVVLTAPGVWWIQRRGRTALGVPVQVERKPMTRGTIVGGVLFGIGWSITGMCPGPIFVNIGEGKVYALAALAGALVGAGLFGTLYSRLQQPFRLPPVSGLRPSGAEARLATGRLSLDVNGTRKC